MIKAMMMMKMMLWFLTIEINTFFMLKWKKHQLKIIRLLMVNLRPHSFSSIAQRIFPFFFLRESLDTDDAQLFTDVKMFPNELRELGNERRRRRRQLTTNDKLPERRKRALSSLNDPVRRKLLWSSSYSAERMTKTIIFFQFYRAYMPDDQYLRSTRDLGYVMKKRSQIESFPIRLIIVIIDQSFGIHCYFNVFLVQRSMKMRTVNIDNYVSTANPPRSHFLLDPWISEEFAEPIERYSTPLERWSTFDDGDDFPINYYQSDDDGEENSFYSIWIHRNRLKSHSVPFREVN